MDVLSFGGNQFRMLRKNLGSAFILPNKKQNNGNMAHVINTVDFLCTLQLVEHVARDIVCHHIVVCRKLRFEIFMVGCRV